MGLGLLGRGLGDVQLLAEAGADLIVTDLKSESELASSLEKLESYKLQATSYKLILGGHRLEDFRDRDYILKAGGVPLDSIYIAEARKNNIPVKMSESWFCELAPEIVTIGVTGTRGKSTVTQLIYEILKAQGPTLNPPRSVLLGGNVRGVSTLSLLKEVKAGDFVVMELDSWRLQGFGDAKISPHIAVFTNLLPDHLNYYGGSMEKYRADKENIFKFQKAGDYLVRGEKVALPADWQLKILGEHNRQNAAMAKKVAEILELDPALTKKVIESFVGVPGRLELVRELGGIKIYNDTTSTTPVALAAALKALGSEAKNIILIMGGADKNLDFAEVIPLIKRFCKELVLLPGTGTDRLDPKPYTLTPNHPQTLKEAIDQAMKVAESGDVILFSPGFASFGPPPGGFKNEFDRGDQFNKLMGTFPEGS